MVMTYYVETPKMEVSILSDGVGKPFSVRLAADDDLFHTYIPKINSLYFYMAAPAFL